MIGRKQEQKGLKDVLLVIDKEYDLELRNKLGTFAAVTKTKNAVHLTMIMSGGLSHTGYWGIVQSEVALDDLFEEGDR